MNYKSFGSMKYFSILLLCSILFAPNLMFSQDQTTTFEKAQLFGQWYFLYQENDKNSRTENMENGFYLALQKDGQFESTIPKLPKHGNWKFEAKTQRLTCSAEDFEYAWKLKNFNEFGMVLISEKNEKWYFSAPAE